MRLRAMADMRELGSGFAVANRELEIRGARGLLGTEQSGTAARVGFDLYTRMPKKSMRQLRGLDLPVVCRGATCCSRGARGASSGWTARARAETTPPPGAGVLHRGRGGTLEGGVHGPPGREHAAARGDRLLVE